MQRIGTVIVSAALAALLVAGPSRADEIGGSGFSVPQSEWLWGIDGLVRTPVDLSVDIGASFRNYEQDGRNIYTNGPFASGRTGTLEHEPESIEGGFRIAGGIGYWSCCVLIEPAMAFRANRPFGNERTDDTPDVFNPTDNDDFAFAELEVKHGWELVFGPQISWQIRDDTPLLGTQLGMAGLPLVFFPVLGVTHIKWDVEINAFDEGSLDFNTDRDFEDDAFTVGFDIDFPLPGSLADFTHALTFGFRWIERDDDHDIGPVDYEDAPGNGRYNFDGLDGWKIGLYYRVTWNDFEGFVKRNIFGPLD